MQGADRWAGMEYAKPPTSLEQADRDLTVSMNGSRDSWLVRSAGAFSDVADQPQMRLLCAAAIGLGVMHREGKLIRTGIAMLCAHTIATCGKAAVKAVVDRTRPDSGDDPEVRRGSSDDHARTSFPSGHSAGAIAVAQALSREYPEHGAAARGIALAVSAMQVPRGTHYLGDVLAGAAIGLIGEQLSHRLVVTAKSRITNIIEARLPGIRSNEALPVSVFTER